MRIVFASVMLIAVYCAPHSVQAQNLNNNPAYDNVHLEHSVEKIMRNSTSSYSLIDTKATGTETRSKSSFSTNTDFLNIPLRKIERSDLNSNGIQPVHSNTQFNYTTQYGLHVLPKPSAKL